MKFLALLPLLLFTHLIAGAQTVIDAVTDAASFAPRVSPGQLATVFGTNLANSTQQANGFPLPRSMAGASVYVNQTAVPLLYVSNTQINFKCPARQQPGQRLCTSRAAAVKALFSSSRL